VWDAVRLPVTHDALVIEGVGVEVVVDGACWDQRVGYSLAGWLTDAEFDAGWIDTLLLRQVLTGVEGTFGGSFGLLLRIRVANHHEAGIGLLVEGQGDVIEAALGFVVYADGATLIAGEAEAAKSLSLWDDGNRRGGDDDVGRGLRGLAEIVDHVTSHGNGAWAEAGGDELGGWS
jgi:hypothetical protein